MKNYKHDTSTKTSCISKPTPMATNAINSTQMQETSLAYDSNNKNKLAKKATQTIGTKYKFK